MRRYERRRSVGFFLRSPSGNQLLRHVGGDVGDLLGCSHRRGGLRRNRRSNFCRLRWHGSRRRSRGRTFRLRLAIGIRHVRRKIAHPVVDFLETLARGNDIGVALAGFYNLRPLILQRSNLVGQVSALSLRSL